jgi:dihydroorotate dehydrogenase electron transfer subunit
MQLVVMKNRPLSADFRHMEVEWPDHLATPLPGQFVMVRTRTSSDPLWRRPLGVHDFRRKSGKASLSLLYQVVGPTTGDLAERRPGESLDLLGPFGRGFSPEGDEHWLVAGGRGIAPLYFFARRLKGRVPVRVMAGGGTSGHVVRAGDLKRMGIPVDVATEDGSRGVRGLVTALLERALGRLGERRKKGLVLSACGPEGMLKAVSDLARRHGAAAQLSLDTLMACGQGYCQGCTVTTRGGYRLCCRDGPVFPSEDLVW